MTIEVPNAKLEIGLHSLVGVEDQARLDQCFLSVFHDAGINLASTNISHLRSCGSLAACRGALLQVFLMR